jgi:hypothetical protein
VLDGGVEQLAVIVGHRQHRRLTAAVRTQKLSTDLSRPILREYRNYPIPTGLNLHLLFTWVSRFAPTPG